MKTTITIQKYNSRMLYKFFQSFFNCEQESYTEKLLWVLKISTDVVKNEKLLDN